MMTHAGEQIALSLKMNLNLHEIVLKSQSCICTTIHDAFNANSIFLVLFERPTHEEIMVLVFFRSFLFPWNLGYILPSSKIPIISAYIVYYTIHIYKTFYRNRLESKYFQFVTQDHFIRDVAISTMMIRGSTMIMIRRSTMIIIRT